MLRSLERDGNFLPQVTRSDNPYFAVRHAAQIRHPAITREKRIGSQKRQRERPANPAHLGQYRGAQATELPGENACEEIEHPDREPGGDEQIPIGPPESLHIKVGRPHQVEHSIDAPCGVGLAKAQRVRHRKEQQKDCSHTIEKRGFHRVPPRGSASPAGSNCTTVQWSPSLLNLGIRQYGNQAKPGTHRRPGENRELHGRNAEHAQSAKSAGSRPPKREALTCFGQNLRDALGR